MTDIDEQNEEFEDQQQTIMVLKEELASVEELAAMQNNIINKLSDNQDKFGELLSCLIQVVEGEQSEIQLKESTVWGNISTLAKHLESKRDAKRQVEAEQ